MGDFPSALKDFSFYKEIAFFPTIGQSTIYNLTHLPSQSSIDHGDDPGCRKYDILVASLLPSFENSSSSRCCNLYSFLNLRNRLVTSTKSFDFNYLPVADIVCIKAFYDDFSSSYVVAMGLVKEDGSCYFNIYAGRNLSSLPERFICLSELDHFPVQVVHTYFLSPNTQKMQWACLLSTSGSLNSALDLHQEGPSWNPVQVYSSLPDETAEGLKAGVAKSRELKFYAGETPPTSSGDECQSPKAAKDPTAKSVFGLLDSTTTYNLFPELRNLPSRVVTYMDFFLLDDGDRKYRLSAFGTLDGWIGVGLVDMNELSLKAFYKTSHDSVITKLKFFQQFNRNPKSPSDVSLLVCSGLQPTVVYRCPFDATRGGKLSVESRLVLPRSADFDHVNCACVADLDFDGLPEIVVGTFDQQLLFYKWISRPDSAVDGSYSLVHQRRVVGAVHSLECGEDCDFLGDGTRCLAVLTSVGLHLFQCSHLLDFCIPLLAARLQSLPPSFECPKKSCL
ncbi:hypothetical protein Aperf_G00000057403 [Anoplocephala perfoliata]